MKSFKNPGGRSLALALHSLYYSVKKGIRQFDDDDDDLGGDLRVEVAGDCDVHIGIQANSTSSSDPHPQDLHQGARLVGAPTVDLQRCNIMLLAAPARHCASAKPGRCYGVGTCQAACTPRPVAGGKNYITRIVQSGPVSSLPLGGQHGATLHNTALCKISRHG